MPRTANVVINDCKIEEIGDQINSFGSAPASGLLKNTGLSKQEKSKPNKQRNDSALISYPIQIPIEDNLICSHSVNSDEANSCDEIKVFNEEGAPEEELRNSESLSEEKTEIIKENSEEKSNSVFISHPFSVNRLMLCGAQQSNHVPFMDAQPHYSLNAAAAAAFSAFNRQPFYNASLYSQELVHHFASWWPTAAAGAASLYTPPNNSGFSFSAFAAANYSAAQQHQAVAAAALAASQFSPSLFLPPSVSSSPSSSLHHSSSSGSSTSPSFQLPCASSQLQNSQIAYSKNSSILQNNKTQMHPKNGSQLSIFNSNKNSLNEMLNHSNPAKQPAHMHNSSKPKKPHIKKPLNAFMLFMKEQRAQVVSECTLRESAAINQILGRKWHELERAEQAKYYEMAREERLKHMQLYPGWSARDNYGLKKKRRRKREKVMGENGELPRKCRARYGLHQLNLWCKPCRRKKKCIRFSINDESSEARISIDKNGKIFSTNTFGNESVEEGSSGELGSLIDVNSDDDDEFDDDYDEEEIENDQDEQEHQENKVRFENSRKNESNSNVCRFPNYSLIENGFSEIKMARQFFNPISEAQNV